MIEVSTMMNDWGTIHMEFYDGEKKWAWFLGGDSLNDLYGFKGDMEYGFEGFKVRKKGGGWDRSNLILSVKKQRQSWAVTDRDARLAWRVIQEMGFAPVLDEAEL